MKNTSFLNRYAIKKFTSRPYGYLVFIGYPILTFATE